MGHLASGSWARRNVLACWRSLSSSDGNTGPSPIRARSWSTKNIDIGCWGRNGTSNTGEGQIGNWDTSGWGTGWGTVLIILLDDNSVAGYAGEGDVFVGYSCDSTSSPWNGLDADTVGGISDTGGGDYNIGDVIVSSAANTANWETVASGAGALGEGDWGSGVDG